MEEYNLTEIISNNFEKLCYIENNYESVVKYFLNDSLIDIFGSNIIDKENMELVTTQGKNGSIGIHIESIYRDPVDITICNGNTSFTIIGTSGDDTLLFMKVKNEGITNYTSYEEGNKLVKESRVVDFENFDAKSFSIIRAEDGKDVYQGTYKAILASNGTTEYFDFNHSIYDGRAPEKPKTVFGKIKEFFHDDTIVSVELSQERETLAEHVDVIFNNLVQRLEDLRVKDDVKVRRKVSNKK